LFSLSVSLRGKKEQRVAATRAKKKNRCFFFKKRKKKEAERESRKKKRKSKDDVDLTFSHTKSPSCYAFSPHSSISLVRLMRMEPSTSGVGTFSSLMSSFREEFELGRRRRRRRRRRSSSSMVFLSSLALFSFLFCFSAPTLVSCTSRGAPCELWPGEKLPPVYARCDRQG